MEKNILDLAAREGLSLYTKDSVEGTLNVTPLAPDSEKNVVDSPARGKGRKAAGTQKGDFIIKFVCLSSHPCIISAFSTSVADMT